MTQNLRSIDCVRAVGPVDAERFIAYVNREKMDYTRWQRSLFAGETIDEIAAQARAVGACQRRERRRGSEGV